MSATSNPRSPSDAASTSRACRSISKRSRPPASAPRYAGRIFCAEPAATSAENALPLRQLRLELGDARQHGRARRFDLLRGEKLRDVAGAVDVPGEDAEADGAREIDG